MLWLVKLAATLALVWAAGWTMRRYGGLVAGMLVGFPVVTAPVAFFMALEQGQAFGASSAAAICFALSGVSAFAIVYGLIARSRSWPAALAGAIAAYFLVSGIAVHLGDEPLIATLWTLGIVAFGLWLAGHPAAPPAAFVAPWWDIWLRLAITALIVLAVTAAADRLGPRLSAIPATYPAITSVITPFVHARNGEAAAAAILRGVLLSHVAFALLFLVVGATVGSLGVPLAYALATAVSLAASALVVSIDRRHEAHPRP